MNPPIDLRPEEIESREQVGSLHGAPVWLVTTTGGYSMVFVVRDGQAQMLSVGPLPEIATKIAEKNEPRIAWHQLLKSEAVDVHGRIFRKYEALTRAIRAERYGR